MYQMQMQIQAQIAMSNAEGQIPIGGDTSDKQMLYHPMQQQQNYLIQEHNQGQPFYQQQYTQQGYPQTHQTYSVTAQVYPITGQGYSVQGQGYPGQQQGNYMHPQSVSSQHVRQGGFTQNQNYKNNPSQSIPNQNVNQPNHGQKPHPKK